MNKLIVMFCMLLAVSTTSAQQSSEEKFLQSRGSKVDAQIPQKQEQLNDLRKELALKKKTLSGLRSKIATVEQDIEKASSELSKSSLSLSAASKRLDAINGELANSEKQNEAAQLSIANASRRNQQLQERLTQEAAFKDSGPVVSVASSSGTVAVESEADIVDESFPESFEGATGAAQFSIAAEPQVDLAESGPVLVSKSLENISEGIPTEEAVVVNGGEDDKAETSIEQKDSKQGAVVGSAKAGGEFVKKETKSVVSSAAKSAVRKGIKGALGL